LRVFLNSLPHNSDKKYDIAVSLSLFSYFYFFCIAACSVLFLVTCMLYYLTDALSSADVFWCSVYTDGAIRENLQSGTFMRNFLKKK